MNTSTRPDINVPRWRADHGDVIDWIEAHRSSNEFARSLDNALSRFGTLTERQVAAVRRGLQPVQQSLPLVGHLQPPHVTAAAPSDAARTYREHAQSAAFTAAHIDLTGLPTGRYAVPGGDSRLKVLVRSLVGPEHASDRWAGFVFVSDAAEYGRRRRYGMQRPGKWYVGEIENELRAILANPQGAAVAYGKLTSHCSVCGRPLEDSESIARGIGPVCAAKRGWSS